MKQIIFTLKKKLILSLLFLGIFKLALASHNDDGVDRLKSSVYDTTTSTINYNATAGRPIDNPFFMYITNVFCKNATHSSPVLKIPGGIFQPFLPEGGRILTIDRSTGRIDLAASDPGKHMIMYDSADGRDKVIVRITIVAADIAGISYSASSYCKNVINNPKPTITGVTGGKFSSTAGLVINEGTGEIAIAASTAGTYTVTYTTAGSCPSSTTTNVTINNVDNAVFNYSASIYCKNATTNPSPTITGVKGGKFSSTTGLVINGSNGEIDLSASTAGTYTVTYRTAGPCPSSSTVTVTINNVDNAGFNYSASSYCKNATNPRPTLADEIGGKFSSTTGLVINGSNGEIDLSASTAGTYTVTYTTTGSCPSSSTATVTINNPDDAGFSYGVTSIVLTKAVSILNPTITGVTGGTFKASSQRLRILSNGNIDLHNTYPGTYTITYTTPRTSGCSNSSSVTLTILREYFEWAGRISSDWNTPENWYNNQVPHNTARINVPNNLTNYPTASNDVRFKTLRLHSGATFIPNGAVSGSITVETSMPTTNWYMWGSTVLGAEPYDFVVNNSVAKGKGKNIGVARYSRRRPNPWDYVQSNLIVRGVGAIPQGYGFGIKLTSPRTLRVTGRYNSRQITISTDVNVAGNDYTNLISNPFLACINSGAFVNSVSSSLREETIWLWNGSRYIAHNNTNRTDIKPGQGFFVDVKQSTSIRFSKSIRKHTTAVMNNRSEVKPTFELFLQEGDVKESTKVFYIEGKTTGFDNGYDSRMFESSRSKTAIFTELITNNDGRKLAIQTLPNENHESTIIPVGIKAEKGKELTFSAEAVNLPAGIEVYLEDRTEGVFTNLSKTNYTIRLSKAINSTGRFYVHTSRKALSTKDIGKLSSLTIFNTNNELVIKGLNTKGALKIFNILGKEVFTANLQANKVNKIALPALAKNMYIVEVTSKKGKQNKKIIIK